MERVGEYYPAKENDALVLAPSERAGHAFS
jgi:hypothetical protein